MSYSMDSYVQEDTCTFPVYQRLRKLNPFEVKAKWMRMLV